MRFLLSVDAVLLLAEKSLTRSTLQLTTNFEKAKL